MQACFICASSYRTVFIDPLGCRGCQIPLLAWCFWEKQWLRYTHSFTIWKGSSDRQTASPRRQTSPCWCRPWTTSRCLCGGWYSSTLKETAIMRYNTWQKCEDSELSLGQVKKLVLLVQRSFPECAVTTEHSRWWSPPTTSIHQLVKCQGSTKCSEVVNPSTVHLLTCRHPICTSQQHTICSPTQRLRQPNLRPDKKAFFRGH